MTIESLSNGVIGIVLLVFYVVVPFRVPKLGLRRTSEWGTGFICLLIALIAVSAFLRRGNASALADLQIWLALVVLAIFITRIAIWRHIRSHPAE